MDQPGDSAGSLERISVTPFLTQLRALVWKELLVEARGRETLLSGVVFALLVLVIFSLSFDLRVENGAVLAPGVLWVTIVFSGVLSIGRGFARERDRRTLEGLLLAPMDRSALYLAKALVNVAAMLLIELVAVPVLVAFFDLSVDYVKLAASLLLGTLGVAGVGTLFGAMAAHTRAREVLLPLLLFPIQVPVILASVKSTGAAIQVPTGADAADQANWLGLLLAFDAIFFALSVLLFDFAVEGD